MFEHQHCLGHVLKAWCGYPGTPADTSGGCWRQALLDSIAADPDTPIGRLSMLGPGEERQLLVAFNDHALPPAPPCHAEQTIHGLLEHWAAATPDAPAAVFEAPPHTSHLLARLLNFNAHV